MSEDLRKEIQNKLDSIILTDEEKLKIEERIANCDITDYLGRKRDKFVSKEFIAEVTYKGTNYLKLTTLHMARYLDVKDDSLFLKMKQLGWSYSAKESQEIAGKKSRNYGDILRKSRKTRMTELLDKGDLSGSVVESTTRSILNEELGLFLSDNYEVIVGVSNRNIITPYEVDIPIIIIHNDKTYKFAIEFNGEHCHINEKDNNKKDMLVQKGWNYLCIEQCSNSKTQKELYGSIEDQITKVCEDIRTIINNNIK